MSSTYSRGLQPVSLSQDRRTSRMLDMDFEDALQSSGTFKIKDSVDLNDLGVEASPAGSVTPTPPQKVTKRPTRSGPGTPVIIPPTPTPAAQWMTAPPSPARSSMDVYYDAEDHDMQTKRRSIYRSPGTSSSPDLATLVRKAKERGKAIPSFKSDKRQELPPLPASDSSNLLAPDMNVSSSRPSTSTSAEPGPTQNNSASLPGPQPREGDHNAYNHSPRTPEKPQAKLNKASVRAKTSAFLGKMWGQNVNRERSKTDARMPNTALADAFQPPLPPIPREFTLESNSPISDAFTGRVGTLDEFRDLPPFRPSINVDSTYRQSEDSIVFIERSPAPNHSLVTSSRSSRTHSRKRSMSVDEVEHPYILGGHAAIPPLPSTLDGASSQQWGLALSGLLTDFKGQLDTGTSDSQSSNNSNTTIRRREMARSATDGALPSSTSTNLAPATPTLIVQAASVDIHDTSSRAPSPPNASPSKPSASRTTSVPNRSPSSGSYHGPSASARYTSNTLRPRVNNTSVGSSRSTSSQYRSAASSSEPSLLPVSNTASRSNSQTGAVFTSEPLSDDGTRPSTSSNARRSEEALESEGRGKDLASKCYAEDEEFLAKEKIAEWLGGHGAINGIALKYYINFFDFSGMRLDHAFRRLCAKLYLKAETQQVDRILEQFSRRYWECNPKCVYGSASLVHAVSYSLLLLNTDLHVAELNTRMSRSQFVRNTLAAIQSQINPIPSVASSLIDVTSTDMNEYPTIRAKRSDSNASWNSNSRETCTTSSGVSTAASSATQVTSLPDKQNGSSTSVPSMTESRPVLARNMTYDRNWEIEMEVTLKEMYNAVKSQQILQPQGQALGGRSPSSSLSPGTNNMLRNRSVRSQPDRMTNLKRGSVRGFGNLINQQGNSPYGDTLQPDGRTSPSPSFATSMGDGYHGSSSSFLTPTLGFASNLSYTIIRETQEDDHRSAHSADSGSTTISITDEELALLGAPWAKEGTLCRKQYWESTAKRAKNKNWMDVFVVIQKGELNMFVFGDHIGGGSTGGMVVGGGNWLENASSVGAVQLAHSLAHALPPPGYNRQRPYCMVLTLANGGVYFFQAGTEDLVNEWVSTCNYWAARTSKEPLAGGVSNMEYGWNRLIDSKYDRTGSEDEGGPRDLTDAVSVRSGKSTRSKFGWRDGSPTVDRVFINDWKAPQPPAVSSVHDEESQMEALQKHVASMKKDLSRHQGYRQLMTVMYPPRSSNALKAQGNWERKSQYLLTEIVKYDSYIDSLQRAMALRMKRRGEKALERALVGDDMGAIAEDDEDTVSPNLSLIQPVLHSDTEDEE